MYFEHEFIGGGSLRSIATCRSTTAQLLPSHGRGIRLSAAGTWRRGTWRGARDRYRTERCLDHLNRHRLAPASISILSNSALKDTPPPPGGGASGARPRWASASGRRLGLMPCERSVRLSTEFDRVDDLPEHQTLLYKLDVQHDHRLVAGIRLSVLVHQSRHG